MEIKALSSYQEFSDTNFKKQVLFQKGDNVVFNLNFMPGQQLPLHKHPGAQVYILVVEGSGTVQVEETKNDVQQGDVINVNGDEQFSFANTSEAKTSLYVFLSKIPDQRYAEDV